MSASYPEYGGTESQPTSMTHQAEQKAGDVMDQAQQKASQLTDQAKQKATSQAQSQKNRAAQRMNSVADAMGEVGQQLRQQQQDSLAEYADTASETIRDLSDRLRETSVSDVVHNLEDTARKQPALFLGGAFALGLLGARFLKSSAPDNQQMTHQYSQYPRRTGYRPPTYQSGSATPVNDPYAGRGMDPDMPHNPSTEF